MHRSLHAFKICSPRCLNSLISQEQACFGAVWPPLDELRHLSRLLIWMLVSPRLRTYLCTFRLSVITEIELQNWQIIAHNLAALIVDLTYRLVCVKLVISLIKVANLFRELSLRSITNRMLWLANVIRMSESHINLPPLLNLATECQSDDPARRSIPS